MYPSARLWELHCFTLTAFTSLQPVIRSLQVMQSKKPSSSTAQGFASEGEGAAELQPLTQVGIASPYLSFPPKPMLVFNLQLSDNTVTTVHEGEGGSAQVILQTEVKLKDKSGWHCREWTVLFWEVELWVLSPCSE